MRYVLTNADDDLFQKKQVRIVIDTYPEVAKKILDVAEKLVDEHNAEQDRIAKESIKAALSRRCVRPSDQYSFQHPTNPYL